LSCILNGNSFKLYMLIYYYIKICISLQNFYDFLANCSWRSYLLEEWDEMKKLYRGPYIDAFCQVWFHLVQLFQRSRLKYEKLTDGRKPLIISEIWQGYNWSAQQDLTTLKFWRKSDYLSWELLPFYASCQVWLHLAKQFQRRFF
jgi:hypothetical protein